MYNNCDSRQLALICQERKVNSLRELEKLDEEDFSYLVNIEEMSYFKDKTDAQNLCYLLQYKCYPYGINKEECIAACEVLYNYRHGHNIYSLIKDQNINVITTILYIFYENFVFLYNKQELLQAVKDGTIILSENKERKERKDKISSYSSKIDIYRIIIEVWGDITQAYKQDNNWAQLYEDAFTLDSPVLCLKALEYGMIIPSWHLSPGLYFRDNISYYLKNESDMYYFNKIGGLYPYQQGKDIAYRYKNMQEDKQGYFLIPLVRKGENNKTTLWTEVKEIDYPLAYYKKGKMWIYEIEELILSFSSAFVCPHDSKNTFTIREINRLEELLVHYFINPYQPLLRAIQKQKNMISLLQEEDKETKKIMEKEDMKDMLLTIFECGMYMRKWKGPGNPYPSRSQDTEDKSDNEQVVQQKLKEIKEKKGDLSILQLKGQGGILLNIRKFEDLYNQVVSGHFCIRVASHYFVNTASYYLLYVYDYKIDKYDYHVDMIV